MATKRFRAGAWRYVVRRAALLPKPVYLSFDSEREGDEYVRRLEALLDRGIVPDGLVVAPKRVQSIRDYARKYLAEQHVSRTDRNCLRIVLERLPADLPLRGLTFAWASAWVTRMKREDNLSPVTIRHHAGALARCLDWLTARGDLPTNPLRMLPKGYSVYTAEDGRAAGKAKSAEERDRRLEVGEEAAIRAELDADMLVLFDLALETAMRMREMYTLTADQIDLRRRTVFLEKTKNGDKRQVPLTTIAVKLLRGYIGGGQMFPWWDGKPESLDRITSMLSRRFGLAFARAGVADFRFHDLRHEATSRFFERTELSEMQIAKITGHRSLRSLARYANLRGSDLAARLW